MSSPNSFKGQYKDFQISLDLNSTNVLGIQALNPQTKDHYSFSINKTYLQEHSQFFNAIDEPIQILQLFRISFQSVRFEGGELSFALGGVQRIIILLFKDPALTGLRSEISSEQERINNEIKALKEQDAAIRQLLLQRIRYLEGRLEQQRKERERQNSLLQELIEEKYRQLRSDMKDIDLGITQSWTGTFRYNNVPQAMNFDRFALSTSPGGPISGSGSDRLGDFQISGSVAGDSVTVSFVKRYISGIQMGTPVTYNGRLINKATIQGIWHIQLPPSQIDTFVIWPVPRTV